MPCAVSFKIVDSTGTAIPNAIWFLQEVRPVVPTSTATQFNIAEKIEADGSGEGVIDLLPGLYSAAADIGTILQGVKQRRFQFRVPENIAASDLHELIDAPDLADAETITPAEYADALENSDFYSTVAAGLADTSDGDIFFVVIAMGGFQVAAWKNDDGDAIPIVMQIEVKA